MRSFWWINRVALIGLAVSTGAVKLGRMPEEMEIFWQAGFSTAAILVFGVVQLVAGLLCLSERTARAGASVLAVTFGVATGVLFVNGMVAFGVFSLVFIAMAGWMAAQPTPPSRTSEASPVGV